MEKFFEIHKDLPREGPGDNQSTEKAYKSLKNLSEKPKILDIGCGPGMQTIKLAQISNGHIVALDNHQPFLDQLKERMEKENLEESIAVVNGSMFTLGDYFQEKTYDLIWSEGAIYIIGFEKGLKAFGKFLKDDGFIAVTELSWLQKNPPKELKDFWNEDYPAMNTIDENLETIKGLDYEVVDYFVLPKSSWWDHYYTPLEKRINKLRDTYQGDVEWEQILDNAQKEVDIFRNYSDYYGYVFYILQKNK